MWGVYGAGIFSFVGKYVILTLEVSSIVEESFTIKNEGAKKMTAGMRLRSTLLDCQ